MACVSEPVRLLDERLFDPPRLVEVERDGAWWPGVQRAWRLCDDHRGWMADVEYVVQHDWGLGTYVAPVPAERVRLRGG